MKKIRIQSIRKSKTIDYSKEIIYNFWLELNDKSNYQSNSHFKHIVNAFNDIQDSVICIQTEKLNHSKITEMIYNASKRRNRIYILTNKKDNDLKQLEGSCLIRYGIQNMGSFILINPNSKSAKGMIYTAPFIEDNFAKFENILLELDIEQIRILFRFFSDTFWNKAKFEIMNDFNNPNDTRKIEPPLDFLPNIKDFCDAKYVRNEIMGINTDAIISVLNLYTSNMLHFNSLKNSKILTSLENNDNELLKIVAQNNNLIFSVNNNIQKVIIAENNNWLIPKTDFAENDNFFAVKLNDEQRNNLHELIKNKINNSEFKFYLSKTRKELEGKRIILLDSLDKKIKIKSYATRDTPKIELKELLPKESFEKQEPEFIDDDISVKINYIWETIPFYTPKNAQKAKLYFKWDKYQENYNKFIKEIVNTIKEIEVIGEKETILKYQESLDKLKNKNLAIINIIERNGIIKSVNKLAEEVYTNLFKINFKVRASEIEAECLQLNKQKTEKINKLNTFIKEQEKKIKEQEKKQNQKLDDILQKYNKKETELVSFKNELNKRTNKKNKKKNPQMAKEARILLNELNEIDNFNIKKIFEKQKQNFEYEIKKIEHQINNKKEEFEKSTKIHRNSFIDKNQSNIFFIPNDLKHLPKIGNLIEVEKEKYLEIEFWEDYQFGQQEASRLNAKLSAKN